MREKIPTEKALPNKIDELIKEFVRSVPASLIMKGGAANKWHFEEWVADHLLACKVGYRFDESTK